MTIETDLHLDTRLLVQVVADLDKDVTAYEYDEDLSETLDADCIAWALIEQADRVLGDVRQRLAKRIAQALPEKRHTVMGAGTFEVHRKADRKKWDREDLLRSVLDTRLTKADPETGEITVVDESPLEKVLEVWNLGAPRVTALRARGLDPDEFCEVEYGGMTLQLIASEPIKAEEAA